MMARLGRAAVVLAAIAILSGCASAVPAAGPGPTPSATPTATPTPTAACPAIEGVELPPECAPYDPDEAMAANDRYRERMPLDDDAEKANGEIAGPLREALEELRSRGALTVAGVEAVLRDGGLADPQVRDDYGDILFGAIGPAGGCVFGAVAEGGVSVEVGGYILDGGCLPAQ